MKKRYKFRKGVHTMHYPLIMKYFPQELNLELIKFREEFGDSKSSIASIMFKFSEDPRLNIMEIIVEKIK